MAGSGDGERARVSGGRTVAGGRDVSAADAAVSDARKGSIRGCDGGGRVRGGGFLAGARGGSRGCGRVRGRRRLGPACGRVGRSGGRRVESASWSARTTPDRGRLSGYFMSSASLSFTAAPQMS